MKDECNGKIMKEFIGIRSKMYCYEVQVEEEKDEEKDEEHITKKGKGIKKHLLKNELRMDHYRDCIMEEKVFKCAYNNIGSDKHQMYTRVNNKMALNPLDDKRYLTDSINSLSYGHKNILTMV